MLTFRYTDKNTIIHRLNPFCKLAWTVAVLVFALIFDDPVYVSILFISTLPLIHAAGIIREWLSLMKMTLFLCLAIIVINGIVSNEGTHILAEAPFRIPEVGTPRITLEALIYGLIMCIKLLAILTAFTMITFTIHPDDLMLSMIRMRLPYKSVLVTSLTTRFVPTFLDDIQRITDVQRSRGVELDKGCLVNRIRNRIAILIPLLSNSLDRAIQVAEAMESKAFGSGNKRSYYRIITFSATDRCILLLILLTTVFGVFLRIWGLGQYDCYPSLSSIQTKGEAVCYPALLAIGLLAMIPMAQVKRRIDID